MTHWGWYWKIKRKHKPKSLCSWFWFSEIDSFQMFKNKEAVRLVMESASRISLEIPRYNLTALLMSNCLVVIYDQGSYKIPIEKKTCNYGGFYYFFKCPQCDTRMRKLYCIKGKYLCRKCGRLGYYSQRLTPTQRLLYMSDKIEKRLNDQAGSLKQKPPHMSSYKFQKSKIQFVKYHESHFYALNDELRVLYNEKGIPYFGEHYGSFVPDGLHDARVERKKDLQS